MKMAELLPRKCTLHHELTHQISMHRINSIEETKTCEQFHLIFKASKLMKTDCSFELDTGNVIIYFEGKKLRKILFYL